LFGLKAVNIKTGKDKKMKRALLTIGFLFVAGVVFAQNSLDSFKKTAKNPAASPHYKLNKKELQDIAIDIYNKIVKINDIIIEQDVINRISKKHCTQEEMLSVRKGSRQILGPENNDNDYVSLFGIMEAVIFHSRLLKNFAICAPEFAEKWEPVIIGADPSIRSLLESCILCCKDKTVQFIALGEYYIDALNYNATINNRNEILNTISQIARENGIIVNAGYWEKKSE
jgi:hypothetical protein